MLAACAAIEKGSRVASPAKSANDPVLTWIRTADWSKCAVQTHAHGLARGRFDEGLAHQDLGDRAVRRAQHREAAAGQLRLERRARGQLAKRVAASAHRELQTVRPPFDVLGQPSPRSSAPMSMSPVDRSISQGRLTVRSSSITP